MAAITEASTVTPTLAATASSAQVETRLPTATAATSTPTPSVANSAAPANESLMGVVIGIIALGLLVGGAFSWFGSTRKS